MGGSPVEKRLVPNADGYYMVGSDGTVWSRHSYGSSKYSDTWTAMKQRRSKAGYMRVKLVLANSARRHCSVHTLVLEAFVGPRPNGKQCRHMDGNPANNNIDNLTWGTPAENTTDKSLHGTQPEGSSAYQSKLTEAVVDEIRIASAGGAYATDLAKKYGVEPSTIYKLLRGDSWKNTETAHLAGPSSLSGKLKGSRLKQSKLTEQSVVEMRRIRAETGESYSRIASKYGVTTMTARGAIIGKSWRHVPFVVDSN